MKKTLFAAGALMLVLLGAGGATAAADNAGRPGKPVGDQTRAQLAQQLDQRFAKLDTNRDGKITPEERTAAGKGRADQRFAALDKDGNGSLSRAEFDARRGEPGGHRGGGERGWHRGGHGHHGFGRGMMDTDKDGTVTKAEFQARALARFDRMDTDHNGVVTPAERQAHWTAMKANRPQRPRA